MNSEQTLCRANVICIIYVLLSDIMTVFTCASTIGSHIPGLMHPAMELQKVLDGSNQRNSMTKES